jgi:hypothetical protein
MGDLGGGEGEGEDCDVVFLAELLGGGCDALCGLGADGGGAVEAKELAGGGLGSTTPSVKTVSWAAGARDRVDSE